MTLVVFTVFNNLATLHTTMKTFLYLSVILLYFQFLSVKSDCPKLDKNNKEWFDLDPFGCYHLGTYDTQRDTATQYCRDLTTGYEISDLAEIRSQEVQFMLTGIFIERNLTKEAWWIGASKVIHTSNCNLFQFWQH